MPRPRCPLSSRARCTGTRRHLPGGPASRGLLAKQYSQPRPRGKLPAGLQKALLQPLEITTEQAWTKGIPWASRWDLSLWGPQLRASSCQTPVGNRTTKAAPLLCPSQHKGTAVNPAQQTPSEGHCLSNLEDGGGGGARNRWETRDVTLSTCTVFHLAAGLLLSRPECDYH